MPPPVELLEELALPVVLEALELLDAFVFPAVLVLPLLALDDAPPLPVAVVAAPFPHAARPAESTRPPQRRETPATKIGR